jgi:GT2 family glycosyltransferase
MTTRSDAGVAAIVVNWKSEQLLGRCLAALAAQSAPLSRLVVVNNDEPGIVSAVPGLDHPAVRVVEPGKNLGFAAGNNRGLRETEGCEWVALVNPDAFPEPGWLAALLAAAAAHPRCSFFASRQVMADDPGRLDGTGDVYAASGLAWRRDHGRAAAGARLEPDEVFGPCAAAALYRKDALDRVGGLDESYFCYFEDVDLAFRLRLLGERCLYVPDAVVSHVGSATSGRRSDFSVYHGHRNLVWTFWKNMPAPLLATFWPHHLALNLVSLVHFTARGQGAAILRAKRDALAGLPRVLRARRKVQSGRKVRSRELRERMVGGLSSLGRGRFAAD